MEYPQLCVEMNVVYKVTNHWDAHLRTNTIAQSPTWHPWTWPIVKFQGPASSKMLILRDYLE